MTAVNLIVAADEPAIFFASVQDAERWMEPIDVEDGVYKEAYGPAGEPYVVGMDGDRVTIKITGEVSNPKALKAILLRYFSASGERMESDIALPDLLNRCTPSYR